MQAGVGVMWMVITPGNQLVQQGHAWTHVTKKKKKKKKRGYMVCSSGYAATDTS
jgi:hypothetical protein